MLSERACNQVYKWTSYVLILVLMEYALWAAGPVTNDTPIAVLILVLMEYALWELDNLSGYQEGYMVLILVLMEYALWASLKKDTEKKT